MTENTFLPRCVGSGAPHNPNVSRSHTIGHYYIILVELLVIDLVSLKYFSYVRHFCDIQNRSSATNIYPTKFDILFIAMIAETCG